MPRPKKERRLCCEPDASYYKPKGIKPGFLEEIHLEHDEYVAMLHAYEHNLSQSDAAERMNVSQPTYSRILKRGLTKTVNAIANGKALVIKT